MKLAVLFLLVAAIVCSSADDCTLTDVGGESKKIAEKFLQRLGPLKGKKLIVEDDDHKEHYTYTIGICESVESSSEDVAILQEERGKGTKVVGRLNDTSVTGGSTWIRMVYGSGDRYGSHCQNDTHRQGVLMFLCDRDVSSPKVKILEENNEKTHDCYYLFEIYTSVICPEESHHISGWGIFFIILFALAASYLVIGFAYKRYILGNRGMDQIPNVNTWITCGNASADLCDKLCRCNRRDELTYASVGQSVPSNPSPLDEDDQLLNT